MDKITEHYELSVQFYYFIENKETGELDDSLFEKLESAIDYIRPDLYEESLALIEKLKENIDLTIQECHNKAKTHLHKFNTQRYENKK